MSKLNPHAQNRPHPRRMMKQFLRAVRALSQNRLLVQVVGVILKHWLDGPPPS